MHTNVLRWTISTALLALLTLALVVGSSPAVDAASVTPVLVDGNPSCASLGYTNEVKFEDGSPPTAGSAPISTGTVAWWYEEGTSYQVGWTTDNTWGVDAVIMKAGSQANVYYYDTNGGPSYGDSGLVTPTNPNNNTPYDLSHVSFCYNTYALSASKDASGSYTRTYSWTINKDADANYTKFIGDPATTHNYTVSVDQTIADSPYIVSGNITINNPAPYPVPVTVTDLVNGTPATVNCPAAEVPASGQLVCPYWADLAEPTPGTNVANIASGIPNVSGTSASDDYTFNQTVSGYPTVNVTDTNGQNWSASGDASWNYTRDFTCPTDLALYENGVYTAPSHVNTATITETGDFDNATVNVTCYAPVVRKDATAEWRRAYDWTITKAVDPATHIGFAGDSFTSDYDVTVDQTVTDYGYKAYGTIYVLNPHPSQPMTVNLADTVNGTTASLDCGGSLLVAPGTTGTCGYSVDLPDNTNLTNTATATFNGLSFLATAPVTFGDPIIEGYSTINVSDSVQGELGPASGDFTFEYSDTFECSTNPDDYTNGVDTDSYPNTATIVETTQSASENVTVTCYAPVVTKTADESFTRTYTWDINKVGDQTELTLSAGQTFAVNYDVTVSATAADSDWTVSGGITIANKHPNEAMVLTDVTDVAGGVSATVSCPVMTVPANGSLFCSYTTGPQNPANPFGDTNTAIAVFADANWTGTAPINFDEATISEIDECIDVADDQYGELGTVCYDELPAMFDYTLDIGPYDVCGEYTFVNVASFVTDDSETTGSDDHTVLVDIPCDGCTLTLGYWKTHSEFGPAPYDDTWALLSPDGADTPFFLSGQSYYEVLWTPPAGNAYYNLAPQYIAAELNFLNGADPSAAQDAFDDATALFNTYTPEAVAALKGNNAVRKEFISLAEILDDYNNGLIGPGHCDEDVSSD